MKTIQIFALLVATFLPGFLCAESYYVELKNHETVFEVGIIKKGLFAKKKIAEIPVENFQDSLLRQIIIGDTPDSQRVLLYFHAMFGNIGPFHKTTRGKLEKINRELGDQKMDKIVSFIWHADGLLYKRNWKEARKTGLVFSRLFSTFNASPSKLNVICHSMGNRVFEGVVEGLMEQKLNLTFETITLAAADLNTEVFNTEFAWILDRTERVQVYFNKKDLLLWSSKVLWGRDRLGRVGGTANREKYSNLQFVNIGKTGIYCLLDPTGHMYMFHTPKVMEDYQNVLAKKGR